MTNKQIEAAARALWKMGNARIGERPWESVAAHYITEATGALEAAGAAPPSGLVGNEPHPGAYCGRHGIFPCPKCAEQVVEVERGVPRPPPDQGAAATFPRPEPLRDEEMPDREWTDYEWVRNQWHLANEHCEILEARLSERTCPTCGGNLIQCMPSISHDGITHPSGPEQPYCETCNAFPFPPPYNATLTVPT